MSNGKSNIKEYLKETGDKILKSNIQFSRLSDHNINYKKYLLDV